MTTTNAESRTVYRTCPLCEATCGLELHLEGKDITLVRGDRDDVFSHGFLCPKGTALKQLESDPDRLRRPQVRRGDSWPGVSWDDAFAEVERGLTPIFERYGRDAVAMYMGNPNVHNLAGTLYSRVLIQAVGSKNLYSAGTVDQMPTQVSAGLMFGMALSMPIPDLARIDAATSRRTARELATASRAAVYGRIGTCTQEFGTLASWLVDVANTLTGNLDRPGGAMFTKPAAGSANTVGTPGIGRGARLGRHRSRVRGLPEMFGELPVVCLAEELETPGEGQVRGMIPVAGNPVLSTPDAGRLDRALESLDFMVSVDIYRNETTRHANVILPPEGTLARARYALTLYNFSVRNVANYSPPVVDLEPGEMAESEILLRLVGIVSGEGAAADPAALDDAIVAGLVQKAVQRTGSNVEGRDPDELLRALSSRRGAERILDLMLRSGPYGDGFGADPSGLSLEVLEEAPHGVDLGPLQPRIPEVLRTASGKIELAPEPIVGDVARLRSSLAGRGNGQ